MTNDVSARLLNVLKRVGNRLAGVVAPTKSKQSEKLPATASSYSDVDLHPIFILGFHRGGTTFLQRLINCSHDVTIWGEHRGVLKFYAQAHDQYLHSPITSAWAGQHGRPERKADQWTAWENKHSKEAYTEILRNHLLDLFAVADGQTRWGFKEIYYADEDVISFLKILFPDCRVLILRRDPVEIFLSQYFVRWQKGWRAKRSRSMCTGFYREVQLSVRGLPRNRFGYRAHPCNGLQKAREH